MLRRKIITDISYRAGLIGTTEPFSISREAVKQHKRLAEVIRQKENNTGYQTAYSTSLKRLLRIKMVFLDEVLHGKLWLG